MSLDAIRARLSHTYFCLPLPAGVEYDAVLGALVAHLAGVAYWLARDERSA